MFIPKTAIFLVYFSGFASEALAQYTLPTIGSKENSAAATNAQNFNIYTPAWMSCDTISSERSFELCTQRDATDAAIRSANLLFWQTLAGTAALIAAALAAIFSGLAVRQAGKGASAALLVGSAEIRPIVNLQIDLEGPGYNGSPIVGYKANYTTKNLGRTPILLCDGQFYFYPIPAETGDFHDAFDFKSTANHKKQEDFFANLIGDDFHLPPGEGNSFSVNLTSPENDIVGYIKDGQDVVFAFYIEYKDALGFKYRSALSKRARFTEQHSGLHKSKILMFSPTKLQQDKIIDRPKLNFWEI